MKMVSASGATSGFWCGEGAAHGAVDELDDPLDEILQAARHAGRGFFGRHAEQKQKQDAQTNREQPCCRR